MKMDLKTLKDIERKGMIDPISCKIAHSGDLKQEAIKWVKELSKLEDSESHTELAGLMVSNYAYESEDSATMISWIMHFFNLTEEDLK